VTRVTDLRDADDPARYGGKAVRLAKLITAGLAVPGGLVLPAQLTDVQAPAAADLVLAWASDRAPYRLIARSSAPAEDGPAASFAGLYTSAFTPAEPGSLLAAIRQVRGAARSATIRAYATARGVEPPDGAAVIVQPALRPYASGVLAAHLETGTLREWCIEAVRGLAEPLVSGQQTGETHRGRHQAGQRHELVPAEQASIVLPARAHELFLPPGEWIGLPTPARTPVRAKLQTSGGGLLRLYPPPQYRQQPILTRQMRDRLLQMAPAAAAALTLGTVDLEWAITPDGALHLLQARPLTRPVPGPAATGTHPDGRTWHGIPASPGQGTGPVAHLDTGPAAKGDIGHGAVIICQNLGPHAASALLRGPAAIAAISGGPLSHAAIVARELGIPCVTAMPPAIASIPAETTVTVDGTGGTLRLTQSPQQAPPAQESTPALTGAAILTSHLPAGLPQDGRRVTVVLHDPGTDPAPDLARIAAATEAGMTSAVFQPRAEPRLAPLPPGFTDYHLTGAGRLAWPSGSAGLPPAFLVVCDGPKVIYQRRITPG